MWASVLGPTVGISLLGDGRSLRLRPKAIMRGSMGFRHVKRPRGSVEVAARGSTECRPFPTLQLADALAATMARRDVAAIFAAALNRITLLAI